ncbi:MAG: ATPase P [Ruminococcus sp.]|nr:ATPase P [Ruminococcus sp.]
MESVIGIVIVIAVICTFAFFVIKDYMKKLQGGCCGSAGDVIRKNKVTDKNKSHYKFISVLWVDGMICQNCQTRIENELNSIDGIWAIANASDGKVIVRMKTPINDDLLRKAVNNLDSYTVMKIEKQGTI